MIVACKCDYTKVFPISILVKNVHALIREMILSVVADTIMFEIYYPCLCNSFVFVECKTWDFPPPTLPISSINLPMP